MNLFLLLIWLTVAYSLLFLFRSLLATEFTAIFLLLFNRPRWGRLIFNLCLLPGVITHELSHFFMAATLGIPTGDINILPHPEDKHDRLGSVKIAPTDPLRESLIGAAPLIVSSLLLVALIRWQFPVLFSASVYPADPLSFIAAFIRELTLPQTWLWFYLIFAISNTMFTSESDRRSWPFLVGVILVLAVSILVFGLVHALGRLVLPPLISAVTNLNIAFTFTLAVDLLFWSVLKLIAQFASWATRRRLQW